MFERFKRECIPYVSRQTSDDWDALALAQHNGLPTRLLDWSENALIAAYFAAWGHDDEDGAIYVIPKPPPAKKIARSPFEVAEVEFFYPGLVSPRISAQAGLFTVHPNPLEPYSPTGAQQLALSKAGKKDIRSKLAGFGVHHASVFADLPSLAKRLSEHWTASAGPQPVVVVPPGAALRPKVNPVDPQKGQWGRSPEKKNWRLSATVKE